MTLKNETAIVGVGATPYYKRGESLPESEHSMACTAILAALADAGLTVKDLDGFAIYSSSCDPAAVASTLGVPEVRFAATHHVKRLTDSDGILRSETPPMRAAASSDLGLIRLAA